MTAVAKKENTDLTVSEESRLKTLEQVIESGMAVFTAVGDALLDIRDGRLYRATHGTFEAYCNDRWKIGKSHAYRMIDHSIVMGAISNATGNSSPVGDISERQAREIKPHLAAVTEEIREKVSKGADPVKTTYEVIEAKRAEVKAKPKAEPEDNPYPDYVEPEPDFVADLEDALKENRKLEAINKTLTSSDLAKEAVDWQMRFCQLEGRLNQAITTKNAAEDQAQYYSDVIKKVRKVLGVDKTEQVLPRIKQLMGQPA